MGGNSNPKSSKKKEIFTSMIYVLISCFRIQKEVDEEIADVYGGGKRDSEIVPGSKGAENEGIEPVTSKTYSTIVKVAHHGSSQQANVQNGRRKGGALAVYHGNGGDIYSGLDTSGTAEDSSTDVSGTDKDSGPDNSDADKYNVLDNSGAAEDSGPDVSCTDEDKGLDNSDADKDNVLDNSGADEDNGPNVSDAIKDIGPDNGTDRANKTYGVANRRPDNDSDLINSGAEGDSDREQYTGAVEVLNLDDSDAQKDGNIDIQDYGDNEDRKLARDSGIEVGGKWNNAAGLKADGYDGATGWGRYNNSGWANEEINVPRQSDTNNDADNTRAEILRARHRAKYSDIKFTKPTMRLCLSPHWPFINIEKRVRPLNTVRASFHQGSTTEFTDSWTGNQCTTMALSAVALSTAVAIDSWKKSIVNRLLRMGHQIHGQLLRYLSRLDDPDTKIGLYEIPREFHLDVSMGDRHALPLKKGVIKYGSFQKSSRGKQWGYTPIKEALKAVLCPPSVGAVMTVGNFSLALIPCSFGCGHVTLVDSHSRDGFGMPASPGRAVIVRLRDINEVVEVLKNQQRRLSHFKDLMYEVTSFEPC